MDKPRFERLDAFAWAEVRSNSPHVSAGIEALLGTLLAELRALRVATQQLAEIVAREPAQPSATFAAEVLAPEGLNPASVALPKGAEERGPT